MFFFVGKLSRWERARGTRRRGEAVFPVGPPFPDLGGCAGEGVVIMAVDILPAEQPLVQGAAIPSRPEDRRGGTPVAAQVFFFAPILWHPPNIVYTSDVFE